MSNKGKEFRGLKMMIKGMEEVFKDHYAYYVRKDDIDKLKQLYNSLIQQKPEIDEEYVKEKAVGLMLQCPGIASSQYENAIIFIKDFITQIIRDAREGIK